MTNFGFVGTGRMATKMANVLVNINKNVKNKSWGGCSCNIKLHSVYSRHITRADSFRAEFGFENANDSLEKMLSDPDLDIVYIASPTSEHYTHAKSAIRAGKAIFVEKPFTATQAQAIELMDLAKNILVAEALWTRYQPLYKTLMDVLSKSLVGKAISLSANLCYPVLHKERLLNPCLAGGALLEVGIYALTFADAIFGKVSDCNIKCVKNNIGIDLYDSVILQHAHGQLSVISCGINSMSDGKGIIHCENGYIEVDNVNNIRHIRVLDNFKKLIAEYNAEQDTTGYEYEISEVLTNYEHGNIECQSVKRNDIVRMLGLCDALREKIGLKYPFE